jgi:hypothetical protein
MPDLARLRSDLAVFAAAIGQPLAPWQAAALRLGKRTTVVAAPRQSGKSRALAVLALWWAYRQPNQHALLISAGEDASKRLLAMCASAAAASPLLGPSVIDEYAAELSLSNGSSIRSVPSSAAAIRGQSIDLLAVDECAQVEPDLLLSAALPTTAARPHARIVLAGSPGSPEGPFYDFARAGERGDEHVESFHWNLADATWIEATVIDAARAQLPAAAFAREYEGVFSDAGADERVIPREWIERAQENVLEPGPVVFGCDVARKGVDSSVIVEMRGPVARVVHSTLGADTMALASRCAQVVRDERGPTPMLAVDEIGVGGPVVDRLVQLGIGVVGYNSSHRAPDPGRYLNTRSSSWWDLREAFRLGEIDIDPLDRELADQLAAVTYSLDSAGRIVLGDKSKMAKSPDRGDALAIASWARGASIRSEQIKLLLDQARTAAREGGHRPSSERLLGEESPRSTEEIWGSPKRERIVDSDLPVFW